MARRKKRMLRKVASHVDTDDEVMKQSIHSPPNASQEFLAERRKLSSEIGRIEEEIGASKPCQNLLSATSCRKKSLCHSAAPVKAVMDSSTSISTRSARRMLSKAPSPKGESDVNAASPQGGEATQTRSSLRHVKAAMDPPPSISTRSLRHIVDNKPRDVLKCPTQPNLPTASPEAATKSEPAAFKGSPAGNIRGSPCRATYKVIGTSSKGSAAAPNKRGSRSRAMGKEVSLDPLLLKSPIGATDKKIGTTSKGSSAANARCSHSQAMEKEVSSDTLLLKSPIGAADKVIGTTNKSSTPAANTRGSHSRAMEKEVLPDPELPKSPISATDEVVGTTNRGSAAAANTSGGHSSPIEKEVSPDPLLLQSPTGSTDEMIGTTNKGSAAAANTRGSHSQAMEKEVSSDPSLLKSPISATDKLIGTKRKRGPTKFKGIDLQSDGPIIVRFNSLGQPVGEGSVSLSSFLGPLVRFIVPYTINDWRKIPKEMKDDLWARIESRYKLDKDWQKDWCMKEMAELWRTSKSRFVSKLNKLPNDEQRLQLKPHNIKSEAEWKAFVQEKTSEKFQERSNKFREMRKNQLPHTCSRRGYARTIDDMKRDSSKPVTWVEAYVKTHLRKNGEPVNSEAAEVIEKLQELADEKPESGSSTTKDTKDDDDDDPLTILFDPDKPGRSLANARGVTRTMLAILRARDDRIAQLEEQQSVLKNQMTEVLSILRSKVEKPSVTSDNTSFTPQNNACNLLDWSGSGKIVAEGRWFSSDPECTVHHVRLGPNAMKVWVDVVKKTGAYLWRPTVQLSTIDEVVGSTVAWPADKVLMRK